MVKASIRWGKEEKRSGGFCEAAAARSASLDRMQGSRERLDGVVQGEEGSCGKVEQSWASGRLSPGS